MHSLVAIVTLLALILYFTMGLQVAGGRSKFKVEAPAMTGNPDFERLVRVQANTLEWLPIFLPSLWLFAFAWNTPDAPAMGDRIAAAIGMVWIAGRILYMTGYSKAAAARGPGFGIQALAAMVLLFGALGRIIWVAVQTGV
jgi:glutathione S-transferase